MVMGEFWRAVKWVRYFFSEVLVGGLHVIYTIFEDPGMDMMWS